MSVVGLDHARCWSIVTTPTTRMWLLPALNTALRMDRRGPAVALGAHFARGLVVVRMS